MSNTEILMGRVVQAEQSLNFAEFRQAIDADDQVIIEMIEYSLVEPEGTSPNDWSFDSRCIRRAKIALSFKQDLEINPAGIALALDLMDQIEQLQIQLETFRKHLG